MAEKVQSLYNNSDNNPYNKPYSNPYIKGIEEKPLNNLDNNIFLLLAKENVQLKTELTKNGNDTLNLALESANKEKSQLVDELEKAKGQIEELQSAAWLKTINKYKKRLFINKQSLFIINTILIKVILGENEKSEYFVNSCNKFLGFLQKD